MLENSKLKKAFHINNDTDIINTLIDKGLVINKNNIDRVTHQVLFMMTDEFYERKDPIIKRAN